MYVASSSLRGFDIRRYSGRRGFDLIKLVLNVRLFYIWDIRGDKAEIRAEAEAE